VFIYKKLILMKYFRKNDFKPDLFHPYYFIRKGLLEKLADKAPAMKGKLLDFGCGSKPYKQLFKVEEYIGLDYENKGHPHDFEHIDVIYDGQNIPFHDNNFDSVLSTEVFEHVFNLSRVLDEINRVMKPNGCLLVTCPFVWNEHEVPFDYARYTVFALESLLKTHGFEVESIDKSGNFISVLFQLYVLYFFQTFYGKFNKFFLTRIFFIFFFIFIPNVMGLLFSMILPINNSLYFNNIVVARKINK
jgi:SAM-dependent methyltransferase